MNDLRMNELKNKLLILNDYISNKNDVIYIDYPLYHNVGDLLIYQGALSFFRENNIKVKCYRSVKDCDIDELKKITTSETTFICQGGGNFGDIYIPHQSLREKIISEFRDNRVIILPQTSHYSEKDNLDRSVHLFRKHPNVVLFARDEQTLNTFKKLSDHSFLLPDMAHHLYNNLKLNQKKNQDTLYFLRDDVEINEQQDALKNDTSIKPVDWKDFVNSQDRIYHKLTNYIIKLGKITNSSAMKNLAALLWQYHSSKLVNRSSIYFSSFQNIVTSRMHGHILSCLVDTKNSVLDNSYGKNTGYYKQWTSSVKCTELFKDNNN